MNGHHQSNGSSCPPTSYQSLPYEIICEIISYISPQGALHAASLVSRRYNAAANPALYRQPKLTSSTIDAFVHSVAPTVFPPPKKNVNSKEYHLADLVTTLDLSPLLYSETLRSSIARLLTHCRNITSLTGSQKSFNGVALRALRHSTKLTHLNLTPCQDSCDLQDFFHTLTQLPHLITLNFPPGGMFSSSSRQSARSAQTITPAIPTVKSTFVYPALLQSLSICGCIIDSTILASGSPPTTITSFSASHLPFVRMGALRTYINMLAPQLTSLSVLHPIPHLPHNFLDKIFLSCPHLLRLTASVDFMTAHIFDEENCVAEHPIERIDLDCSGGMGSEFKISSDDISIALMEGRLRRLRVVRASKRLGWARRSEEKKRVEDLAELLIMDRSGFGEENEEEGSQEDDDMRSEYVMVEKEDPVVDIVGTDDDDDNVEDELSRKFAGVYIF
ncbi:hypothetical protein EYR41_007352 [Orbilia oligospora]|uniref:Uncharacterized protein n=1 Tax=Orbilia oligospora TaxID=2813651 RepID=A0A7C8NZH3_ORBOL|nr:hypothetical protein TWF751_011104 [Orbilia oligospora]TGJ68294.1 hypothetical protein EYR41_007352 [Orbilia oligospora]